MARRVRRGRGSGDGGANCAHAGGRSTRLRRAIAIGVRALTRCGGGERRVGESADRAALHVGLALVPADTPTNNIAGEDAGFRRATPRGRISPSSCRPFRPRAATQRAPHVCSAWTPGVAGKLAHAGMMGNRDREAMAAVLWPATGGYFLEQLLADSFADEAIDAARRHTIQFVRARDRFRRCEWARSPTASYRSPRLTTGTRETGRTKSSRSCARCETHGYRSRIAFPESTARQATPTRRGTSSTSSPWTRDRGPGRRGCSSMKRCSRHPLCTATRRRSRRSSSGGRGCASCSAGSAWTGRRACSIPCLPTARSHYALAASPRLRPRKVSPALQR